MRWLFACIRNTDSVLRFAAFRISLVVIPMFATLEQDAPRTEWALKIDVSMPAACSSAFNHCATVQEVTDLCGLMRAKNSPFLRLSVLSSSTTES